MTRKKDKGIKRTSRKTGAIILTAFVCIIALALTFTVLSWGEREKQIQEENEFRKLSCNEMLESYKQDNPKLFWKWDILVNKTNAGGC